MSRQRVESSSGERVHYLDNLRTAMIFLVIVVHAGLVYESSGLTAFFWIVDDPATNNLSGIFNLIFDVFVMSVIFFVSGYLAPGSLERKGERVFLTSKLKRLMIPWLISVFTLIPLYKIIFLYSRGLPQEKWTSYFHSSNGIYSQNWLWFLPVLFLFNALFIGFRRSRIDFSRMSLRFAALGAFLLSLGYGVAMDIFRLQGWTKTVLIDFQNERILIYLVIFLLGAVSYRSSEYRSSGEKKRLYIFANCAAWIPMNIYIFMVIYSLIKPNEPILSSIGDMLILRFSYTLSLFSMLYVMVMTFKKYLNKSGKLWRKCNANSYGVYIVHVVVLGAIALLLLDTGLPSIWKYLTLIGATYVVSNLIVSAYRATKRRLASRLMSQSESRWPSGVRA